MQPLHPNGHQFVNQTPLRALIKALVMRKVMCLPHDIFCFEVARSALYDGVSLEEISRTATYQLATGIVEETVLWANGNKSLAARLLQIDEVTLESWLSSTPCAFVTC